ncbi:hypothetical protein Bca52824_096470, partial [Brassica carinata]
LEAINRDRKLFLVSLYFLIWGEAANVRFLPECICYIFHNMAKELDARLDHGEAVRADSCVIENGSVSFLDRVISPIYAAMSAETLRNNNGKAAHSEWRNYDDFNEYFWTPGCFELSWPMKPESKFLTGPKGRKRTGKSSFVEHRTYLHLFRSFHRLWIFMVIMFQALAIIAFRKEHLDKDTFKILLSAGATYAIMNFIESFLDVVLMYGAYSMARGMAISRVFIKFFWWGLGSVFVVYVYVKVLQERTNGNSDEFFYRLYILVLGSYAAVRFIFGLLVKLPACHALSEMSDHSFFQFFKWIYQERYFVGRGLFENISDYCRYVAFWLIVLASKFTFAYFLQARMLLQLYIFATIKPLVKPTKTIIDLPSFEYSWHDIVSKSNDHALTIVSLWAPVVCIYLMDIHIWYTLLSAIIGGVMGAKARLGEIRSIEMVHKRFESFPEAFAKNLVSPVVKRVSFGQHASQDGQDMNKAYAAMFSPFWNEIIKSLREEDYISNREMDLLSIPSNTGSLGLVQWPLFLLCSKILVAIDLAMECTETQGVLWRQICDDEYMAYAVQECYYSVQNILNSMVDGVGLRWSDSTGDVDLQESATDALELRFWVSFRGQTLARTVRGMMYYRRALMLQSFLERRGLGVDDVSLTNMPRGFEASPEARAQADLKFTYVVSCQIYGQQKQQKKPEATDIALLLQRFEALRVAFIHSEDVGVEGKRNSILRKPENQNHAIVFTRGEAIQTIDMNQDNYLEEAIKMRNLLEEFHGKHGIRRPTILGVREHVFTGSVSSLAWFMSNQETSFVTLGQRVLAYPLNKASRVINISEDIYAGFNSTLRQGNITHHEYIQVGKGRDVGLNQIALFEGKVAGGNGEQVLSRDVYRIGQLFDFFRMMSFYFTTVGFYVCTMVLSFSSVLYFCFLHYHVVKPFSLMQMTVLTVYVFLYGRVYLVCHRAFFFIVLHYEMRVIALSNVESYFQLYYDAISAVLGLFTFSLGTRTHYFGRTILHGGAKYRATGRGFVVQHIKFADNYRLYSRSHFVKAFEVALLLIVYIAYGYTDGGAVSFVLLTISSWFLVISWLFAPYIFNPSGFEWQKWSRSKGELSWESWWEEEQMHIQTLRGRILETILSLRFFMFQYGVVYKLNLTGKDQRIIVKVSKTYLINASLELSQ